MGTAIRATQPSHNSIGGGINGLKTCSLLAPCSLFLSCFSYPSRWGLATTSDPSLLSPLTSEISEGVPPVAQRDALMPISRSVA